MSSVIGLAGGVWVALWFVWLPTLLFNSRLFRNIPIGDGENDFINFDPSVVWGNAFKTLGIGGPSGPVEVCVYLIGLGIAGGVLVGVFSSLVGPASFTWAFQSCWWAVRSLIAVPNFIAMVLWPICLWVVVWTESTASYVAGAVLLVFYLVLVPLQLVNPAVSNRKYCLGWWRPRRRSLKVLAVVGSLFAIKVVFLLMVIPFEYGLVWRFKVFVFLSLYYFVNLAIAVFLVKNGFRFASLRTWFSSKCVGAWVWYHLLILLAAWVVFRPPMIVQSILLWGVPPTFWEYNLEPPYLWNLYTYTVYRFENFGWLLPIGPATFLYWAGASRLAFLSSRSDDA